MRDSGSFCWWRSCCIWSVLRLAGVLMKVLDQDDVSIKLIAAANEIQSPKSQITVNGTKINALIDGVYLESCIKCKEYYLAFTTDDCPFEESLNIYLLSQENKILDNATVFWPYGTGSFELLKVADPNLVFFKFFDDKTWQVEIYQNKRFAFPYISEPGGVWRKLRLTRYFEISEVSSLKSTA